MGRGGDKLDYGIVYCFRGQRKGRIFYYDDDESDKTAICYVGHPMHFNGYFLIRQSSLRDPTVNELIERQEVILKKLTKMAIDSEWDCDAEEIHELWSEKDLISEELFQKRYMGEFNKILVEKEVFLCHSSADKGRVRMLHDDLKRLGVDAWLDENEIEVGESIVAKISEGLGRSKYLIACLSKHSVGSKWAKKEWQSFLMRALSDENIFLLPALFDDCEVPPIIKDLKFADFRESFSEGFRQIYRAISRGK